MANIGGKVNLFQPVAFASGLVSIGDTKTLADGTLGPTVFVDSMAIGPGSRIANTVACIVVGTDSEFLAYSENNVVIGRASLNGDSYYSHGYFNNVIVGNHSVVKYSANSVVLLGDLSDAESGTHNSVGIGCGVLLSQGAVVNVAMGASPLLLGGSHHSVVLGSSTGSGGGFQVVAGRATASSGLNQIAIGDGASTIGANLSIAIGAQTQTSAYESIAIGVGAIIGMLSDSSVAIGPNTSIPASCPHNIVIGSAASVLDGTIYSMAIGPSAICHINTSYSLAIGANASVGEYSVGSIVIGSGAVAFGRLWGSNHCIVIGSGSVVVSDEYIGDSGCIIIGSNSRAGYSPAVAIIGPDNNVDVNCDVTTAIGFRNYTIYTSEAVVVGMDANDYGAYRSVNLGYTNTLHLSPYTVIAGYFNSVNDTVSIEPPQAGNGRVVIGSANQLHDSTPGSVVFGINNSLTASAYSTVIGRVNTVEDGDNAIILAFESSLLSGSSPDYAIMLGHNQTVSAAHTISMGLYATNSVPNTMVVGDSRLLVTTDSAAIHTLTIKGFNGVAIDTLVVTDNPANPGDTGLGIVCNIAAAFSNKIVKAASSPGAGSKFLYILP